MFGKISINRYIRIALIHRDLMKRYESGKLYIGEMEELECEMARFSDAILAVGHHDINDIRKAERDAGIEEKYRGFS